MDHINIHIRKIDNGYIVSAGAAHMPGMGGVAERHFDTLEAATDGLSQYAKDVIANAAKPGPITV